MNKSHLAVAVVAILALSSSTVASAEGGSHRRMGGHKHISSVASIGLNNNAGVLTIDTSTATPRFHWDTKAVTPHIDFDSSKLITHFDTSTATSNFDDEPGISGEAVGEDDFLPTGSPRGFLHPVIPPAVAGTPPASPAAPVAPTSPVAPVAPSWITKPHAKSNDESQSHSDHSSEDSQD